MKVGHSICDPHKVVVVKERSDRITETDYEFWLQLIAALRRMGIRSVKSTARKDRIVRPDPDDAYLRDSEGTFRIYYAGAGVVSEMYRRKRHITLAIEDLTYQQAPPVIGDRLSTPLYYQHEMPIGAGI